MNEEQEGKGLGRKTARERTHWESLDMMLAVRIVVVRLSQKPTPEVRRICKAVESQEEESSTEEAYRRRLLAETVTGQGRIATGNSQKC